jgi:hypothetical protein
VTPAHTTSLLETSDMLASRVGVRGVDGGSTSISSARSTRTTPETHSFSVPVVREMAPRQVSFPQTW